MQVESLKIFRYQRHVECYGTRTFSQKAFEKENKLISGQRHCYCLLKGKDIEYDRIDI